MSSRHTPVVLPISDIFQMKRSPRVRRWISMSSRSCYRSLHQIRGLRYFPEWCERKERKSHTHMLVSVSNDIPVGRPMRGNRRKRQDGHRAKRVWLSKRGVVNGQWAPLIVQGSPLLRRQGRRESHRWTPLRHQNTQELGRGIGTRNASAR